jgi:hypothetical protein
MRRPIDGEVTIDVETVQRNVGFYLKGGYRLFRALENRKL